MNAQAAKALYDAERKGVQQIRGRSSDGVGGVCAQRVLFRAGEWFQPENAAKRPCPLCGFKMWLVEHLNDDHELTFSEIARKLGPDSV